MKIKVRLFAKIRDMAGVESLSLAIRTGTTIRELRIRLASELPTVRELLPRCAISLNQEFVEDHTILTDGAEVSILPPVSGGER